MACRNFQDILEASEKKPPFIFSRPVDTRKDNIDSGSDEHDPPEVFDLLAVPKRVLNLPYDVAMGIASGKFKSLSQHYGSQGKPKGN